MSNLRGTLAVHSRLISALNRVRRGPRWQTYETRNGKYRRENYNRLRENRLPPGMPRLGGRRSWLAIVIRKKITRRFRRDRRTRDKIRVRPRRPSVARKDRRQRERRKERRDRGWRWREEIHYHKAGNFTRIMPELRIPRDTPRCCLSLSKFRHNGHTSTPWRCAFSCATYTSERSGSSSESSLWKRFNFDLL